MKEERELKMISDNLTYCDTFWTAGYPWIKNPYTLPDNYCQALKDLVRTENRLDRDPIRRQTYCEQMDDMFTRHAARKLSVEEIESYHGPVF